MIDLLKQLKFKQKKNVLKNFSNGFLKLMIAAKK